MTMTYAESQGFALRVTSAQVDAINALLPDRTWVAPVPIVGALFLGADLLSDCGPGGTYGAAREILEGLTPEPWPGTEEA